MILCRHCCKKKANRSRGLCWHCYYTPGVRELYTSGNKYLHKREATMEELDAMEAEARKNLPDWWHKEGSGARDRRDE